MITLTSKAISKVRDILPTGAALRVGVQGGGCSGFSYALQIDNEKTPMDKEFEFDGIKVLIDATSLMYIKGTEIDYKETLEASGFQFNNPNVKNTCGCGSSFSV